MKGVGDGIEMAGGSGQEVSPVIGRGRHEGV